MIIFCKYFPTCNNSRSLQDKKWLTCHYQILNNYGLTNIKDFSLQPLGAKQDCHDNDTSCFANLNRH